MANNMHMVNTCTSSLHSILQCRSKVRSYNNIADYSWFVNLILLLVHMVQSIHCHATDYLFIY